MSTQSGMRAAGAMIVAATSLFAAPLHGKPVDVVAGFGIASPSSSPYRDSAYVAGWDARALRHTYEAEVGGLYRFCDCFALGLLARGHWGRLGAPYDGLPAIATDAYFAVLRAEYTLVSAPRILVWADPSYGIASIGVSGQRTTMPVWGFRAGFGLSTNEKRWGVRFRMGYAYSPTLRTVTDAAGGFNFGGFVFMIDGVIRVLG